MTNVVQDTNRKYVHFGCGLCAPPTWWNFDASPTLLLQRIPLLGRFFTGKTIPNFPKNVFYGDIVRGLAVPLMSCSAIYCSHVLEHLSLEDFRCALRNTYSYLEPFGTFRLVVPDLRQIAQHYLDSREPTAAIEFMESTYLGRRERHRSLVQNIRAFFGNSQHLWMWDYESLTVELASTGFVSIRRAELGDSLLSCFEEVEDPTRWLGGVGMECRRE